MEDDNSSEYNDGDIVWVKLSYCWWPGEVLSGERLTDDFLSTLKRRPLAVVKFFDEDSYEYVKNTNFIYKYNCIRKNEFLRKGLEQYRSKNKHMEKFPSDVMHAERATGGDPNIVNSSEFLPQKRENYSNIFQSESNSKVKGKASTPRSPKKSMSPSKVIPVIPVRKHEVRILAQASSATGVNMGNRGSCSALPSSSNQLSPLSATPRSIHSSFNSSLEHGTPDNGVPLLHNNSISPSQFYHCHKCGFESGRQNVIVLHTKYCRAVPIVPSNVPSVRASKPTTSTPNIATIASTTKDDVEFPAVKMEVVEDADASVQQEVLVEVIQVVESTSVQGRSSRASRAAAMSTTPTPKLNRRKNRRHGKAVVADVTIIENSDSVDMVFMKVEGTEEPIVESATDVEKKKNSCASEKKEEKDNKGKPDVELKNELLADWSEDEQEEQDEEAPNHDKSATKTSTPTDEAEKDTIGEEKVAQSSNDSILEKATELSPQITSPVSSSGTIIKYRNIPKKQKREFIEVVTNDQPSHPASAIEKSSSDSSISTAATCGETLSAPDKTPTPGESPSERPISAKQRILDRATRGSSKSVSSDELKQESSTKVASLDNQQASEDESKKETSCFDFKEEEEEEVVLNKSPRRSLSNRRDTSLEHNASVSEVVVKDQDDQQERAKKDTNLRNEIESLLSEASVPSLPEIPKTSRAISPVPSSSSTETTPQSKEDIDRNRTLPPKERGKRIFKTRNKVIENEAIALEQSKAIVMDFVKKSHEEELAELREQQEAEAKQCSESPTTTNDDSQGSLTLNEPTRFENSEFAAIKAKRTKIPQTDNSKVGTGSKETPQESFVSSSNETKATETESMPVSISKDQLALDTLQKSPVSSQPTKGRKGKYRKPATPTSVVEKSVKSVEIIEQSPRVEEPTQKRRKKRSSELDNLDLTALDTPRSRRGRSVKPEEPAALEVVESVQSNFSDKQRKMKRSKREEVCEESPQAEGENNEDLPSETMSLDQPKAVKSKRSKQLQQQSADSTADLLAEPGSIVPTDDEKDTLTVPEAESAKQQPIKMIIKSKGRKSNPEIVFNPVIASPEPEEVEGIKSSSPVSVKSFRRRKGTGGMALDNNEQQSTIETSSPSTQNNSGKSLKPKRPKLKQQYDEELSKSSENLQLELPSPDKNEPAGPSVTDLQIAEALINLPEATPPKVLVLEHEPVDVKTNSSPLPATTVNSGSTVKTINPRKRHLQTLLSSPEVLDQPKQTDRITIPEKKKRETIEVVSVAPATIVLDKSTVANSMNALDDDKFDIDNIPIVMDDSELLEDSTISTTTVASIVSKAPEVNEDDDDVRLITTTKSATKAAVVVLKGNNDSSKSVDKKETAREISSPVPKKTLGVKSTTITIKPPSDQLSPQPTQSPAHSPPLRSAQLVQAGSGGQIVITSKGTVLTTQSPATSSSKTHLTVTPKAQVVTTQSSTKNSTVTSVSSLSTISSSTSKPLPSTANSNQQRINRGEGNSTSKSISIKSSAKICVQSQEIIHHPSKQRSATKETESNSLRKTEMSKKIASSTSPPKKIIMKKLSDPGLSSGKPLFSTSKGAPITSQPATSSALSHGKKAHRVIKISPQKLKEFTRLGMVEDKGQGKVLTASGMRKFRQEQQLLQQQQKAKSGESKKVSRADSIEEEPSTSTPTPPPPPSDTPNEVVIAAAADSSVKEIPVLSSDVEEPTDLAPSASAMQSPDKSASPDINTDESLPPEENEADATVEETEVESSTPNVAEEAEPPSEAAETIESTPIAETSAETGETGSNVQESSQLIAVPAENFGGPANLFYLCSVREEGFVPVNNELLYLDSSNQLVALPEQASVEDLVNQAEVLEISTGSDQATVMTATASGDIEGIGEAGQQNILLNTQDGQQIILDQQSLMALAAGGDTSHLLTPDGQQILLQGSIFAASDSVDEVDPEL